jgi:ribonuclease BN (tRNA processing enzyme)
MKPCDQEPGFSGRRPWVELMLLLCLAASAVWAAPPGQPDNAEAVPVRCNESTGIQVLGSGGPQVNSTRASAGYLIWIDGKARALVDAGGGVFLRFGQAGARIEDLDVVALTHLHVDHSSDFPALLKAGYFSARRRGLPLLGPTGDGAFPGLQDWLNALLAEPDGAYHYLAGYLDGSDGLFGLDVREVDASARQPQTVFESPELVLKAVGVVHGSVPALGLLAIVKGHPVAFSGDQNGHNPAFARMISGAELLIMDYAIPEDAGRIAAALHARPSEIAQLAADADVHGLVLSHLMPRSERVLAASLAIIRKTYTGPLTVADDMLCLPLPGSPQQTAETKDRLKR